MNQMVEAGGWVRGAVLSREKIHQNPQNPPAGPFVASSILCSHYVLRY
jgi:hypothetical protein